MDMNSAVGWAYLFFAVFLVAIILVFVFYIKLLEDEITALKDAHRYLEGLLKLYNIEDTKELIGRVLVLQGDAIMTVHSIEVAKEIVEEAPKDILAVYKYRSVSGDECYSIETLTNQGSTERSAYVSNPQLIYTPQNGWSV